MFSFLKILLGYLPVKRKFWDEELSRQRCMCCFDSFASQIHVHKSTHSPYATAII